MTFVSHLGSIYVVTVETAALVLHQHLSVCLRTLQVLSVIPFKFVPEPVLIKVANHTECRCMEPAIIRRNAQPHRSSG